MFLRSILLLLPAVTADSSLAAVSEPAHPTAVRMPLMNKPPQIDEFLIYRRPLTENDIRVLLENLHKEPKPVK